MNITSRMELAKVARGPLMCRTVATIVFLTFCHSIFIQDANAFLGFGDEEVIPGNWEGPQGSLITFVKDGRGVLKSGRLIGTYRLTVNFSWSVHWGHLRVWNKDNTFAGWMGKAFGEKMDDDSKIVFHGANEFVLDDQSTFTRAIEK